MKQIKTFLSLVALVSALVATSISAYAQTDKDAASRTVTGKVLDQNGDPVIGAMVVLEGTTNGSSTDLDGNFSLNIKKNGAVLEVSCIGYQTTKLFQRPSYIHSTQLIVHVIIILSSDNIFVHFCKCRVFDY